MKKRTKNASYKSGFDDWHIQCLNRYHEKREPTRAGRNKKVITKSDANLKNRCKISAIHKCTYPYNSEKNCPMIKGNSK